MTGPRIGTMVHVVYPTRGATCLAAVVTEVDGERIYLTSFPPCSAPDPGDGWIPYDETKNSGWHWPCVPPETHEVAL